MLKFNRDTDGVIAIYEVYDGTSTIVFYFSSLNEMIEYNKHRSKLRLSHRNEDDIPATIKALTDMGLVVKDTDYNAVRDLVEDMYDISAIKAAEMF